MVFSLAPAVLGYTVSFSSFEPPIVQSDFSFANWVDSVIADPSTALSPEEAVAAFDTKLVSPGKPQTYDNCQQSSSYPASVDDAVWCINDLARRGHAGQICDVSNVSGLWQCARRSTVLVTVRGPNYKPMSVNWYVTASEKVRAKWLLTEV
jgi:hypothetical protein